MPERRHSRVPARRGAADARDNGRVNDRPVPEIATHDRSASSVTWRIAAMGFLGGIGGGVVFPILPALGERMGLSALMVGVILAANRIVRLGVNPVTGALTDRFGGREVIAAGLFIEGIGTVGYIAALHYPHPAAWFLAGRVVWGVGSSFLFVGAVAAVLALSAARQRGRLVARARSAISLGMPAGLVIGGLVTDLVSADAAFVVAAVLSAGAGLAALAGIPRREHRSARAADAARPAHAPLRAWLALLGERRLFGIWLYAALVFFSTGGLLLATLVVLIDRRGLLIPGLGAEGSAGLLMGVLMLLYAGTSVSVGRRIDALGRRTVVLLPTLAALVGGFALLAFAHSLASLIAALVAIGAGTGGMTIPLLTLLGDLVPAERRGRATGIYQVAADAGGSAGPIVGLVLATGFGFMPTYLGLAGLFLLTVPVAFALARTERRSRGGATMDRLDRGRSGQ